MKQLLKMMLSICMVVVIPNMNATEKKAMQYNNPQAPCCCKALKWCCKYLCWCKCWNSFRCCRCCKAAIAVETLSPRAVEMMSKVQADDPIQLQVTSVTWESTRALQKAAHKKLARTKSSGAVAQSATSPETSSSQRVSGNASKYLSVSPKPSVPVAGLVSAMSSSSKPSDTRLEQLPGYIGDA